ncbi:hypothetical protein [Rhodococcus gordoniae]|uniref:hypothetical protein n=1 Tax=Rhodococcus gordoniae TaxID=223392 RepID=UPI0020CDBF65|nr:hypothetical protein [Rhodococcus gordoniae]UTT48883.1 hypothetical protein NMQ04_01290 [Rhodococcus gordoniae]
MTNSIIADASALYMMTKIAHPDRILELLAKMTTYVEDGQLCFPREVAQDLGVTARNEPIAGWATGLGRSLSAFRADIKFNRPLVAYAKSCGFDEGFSTISGEEPSIVHVGRLACQYSAENREFKVASEDTGENPISPTMEQLCSQASWTRIDARATLVELGLSGFL